MLPRVLLVPSKEIQKPTFVSILPHRPTDFIFFPTDFIFFTASPLKTKKPYRLFGAIFTMSVS
ncbi:hypothetical protein QJS04_geneDACA015437 [Acorus gramineus]|uniref:Uncharacterized protein n=1 Tax=Acorus gramineus TaxID=55184 RepID=A0AAV9A6U5_ACOGR|nr:hypothetical protein QJS04_geneDACA015437 [Acorus gramineus]